jgi:hypothetical protein
MQNIASEEKSIKRTNEKISKDNYNLEILKFIYNQEIAT